MEAPLDIKDELTSVSEAGKDWEIRRGRKQVKASRIREREGYTGKGQNGVPNTLHRGGGAV